MVQVEILPAKTSTTYEHNRLLTYVYFDPLLAWDVQVRNITKTIMGSLYALNRHRNFIPNALKPKLVQSLLFPHFYYCDTVYHDINQNLANKLQKVQNSCIRYACQLRKYDHVSPYYRKLKWQKLDVLRRFHMSCMVYKSISIPSFPSYMKNNFVSLSESHGRSTRSKDSLVLKLPKFNLNAFKLSFVCSAIRLWNSLHSFIRASKSLSQFKTRFSARYFE
jgi:hypothetical protein